MNSEAALWGARVAELTELPDQRLNKRLACVLATFASDPQASIPQACDGWADTKGTYRFLENQRVADSELLQGVARHTASLASDLDEILVVQDSSSLNFTRLTSVEQLGPIDSAYLARGLFVHSSLALNAEGKVLGLLDLQVWVRPPQGADKPQEKESLKWIYGIEKTRQVLAEGIPEGRRPLVTHIMDREGDCFDVLLTIDDSGDNAVIRCVQNRKVEGPLGKAHDEVRAQPLLGVVFIDVPRKPGQQARVAEVEVRSLETVLVPDREKYPHGWQMEWNLVEVWERRPPEGEEGLHWLLWTKQAARSLEEALRVVGKYRLRWPVEDYHLTLKSGCRIEQLQLQSWEALLKAVVLYAAVAARIVQLRDWARLEPLTPAKQLLDEDECSVLRARCDPKGKVKGELTLAQAVLWIGRLGGHLNRKSDGMPGVRTLWKGLRDLNLLVQGFRAARLLLE